MAKYQPYPAYKSSGVEWLGDVPSDWEHLLSKRFFKNRRESSLEGDQQLAASQAYGVIPQELMMKLNAAKVMLALKGTSGFKRVYENDFVISLRSFEGGIEHSAYNGCVSPAYTVLYGCKNEVPEFYKYLFKSRPFISALQSSTDSLRDGKSITYEQFSGLWLIQPSKEEQQKIAAFLDYETAQMDDLVAKQEKLIELLKEKRQAVISHAVTKGLNPNAEMKDSGVEWLGQIPKHWGYAPVRRYLSEHKQGYYTTDSYVDDGTKLLRITDLRDYGKIDVSNCPKVPSSSSLKPYLLSEGDVVFARTGGAGSFGVVHSLEETVVFASYLIRFRFCKNTFNRNYQQYVFLSNSFQLSVKSNIHGGVTQNIHAEDVKNTYITLPSLDEQNEIVTYLDNQTAKIDKTIEKAEQAIELIKERRTALISAAVTGKIDVRGWEHPAGQKTKEVNVA